MIALSYISITFLLIALFLIFVSGRQKKQAGIPAGRVIYTDTSRWAKVEKPLYVPDLHLTGKPDYLVALGDRVIPVEVKSRKAPPAPYDSHIYQLAAYCLLVQHYYDQRPSYGIIHYSNRTFEIEFSSALEEIVKATIHEMQGKTTRSQVDRSHEEPKRCLKCGFRQNCDQSLRI